MRLNGRGVVFGLFFVFLLEIALLAYMLSPLSQMRFDQNGTLLLIIPFYVTAFLAPAVCLIYAHNLEA